MGRVDWRGEDWYREMQQDAVDLMERALDAGVAAAQAQSTVLTGNYRDNWRKNAVEIRGDVVHGEIVNEARNRSGGFYGAYRSGGTSRMAGDFAHAAALDRGGAVLAAGLRGGG